MVNRKEGEGDPPVLSYLLDCERMGNRNSLEKHSGKGEQKCGLLPFTPPQVDIGSDRAEEFGGAQNGERRIPWEGCPGRDGQGGTSDVYSTGASRLKVSPSHMLSNPSHIRQPPPAKANFHAKLFIIATQQIARKCQNPSAWGEWTGAPVNISPPVLHALCGEAHALGKW